MGKKKESKSLKKVKVTKPSPKKEKIKIVPEKRVIVEAPKVSAPPVTYQEHLEAGWVVPNASENLQRAGKKVTEIKNVEGKLLHKL